MIRKKPESSSSTNYPYKCNYGQPTVFIYFATIIEYLKKVS